MTNLPYRVPAVSVIIPMYNVEKYIAQCLGSLLSQTFQDFEVIVVDDCSTDNSVAIVESIAPKFNGRLKLIRKSTNSGGGAIPRNIGIRIAKGKYITFVDSDDLITNEALKILYESAEKTQADVVHTGRYFVTHDNSEIIRNDTKLKIVNWVNSLPISEITFESDDIKERIKHFGNKGILWFGCNKLFRSEFLANHYIDFPKLVMAEDIVFVFKCLCLAHRYVLIPDVFYVYRDRKNSVTRHIPPLDKYIHKILRIIIDGINILDDFMNSIDIFRKNPEYKFMVINIFMQEHFDHLTKVYMNTPPYVIDEMIRKEFFVAENLALESYLFNISNIYRFNLTQAKKQIAQLKYQIEQLKQK